MSENKIFKATGIILLLLISFTIHPETNSDYRWGFSLGTGISILGDLEEMESGTLPVAIDLFYRFTESLDIIVHSDIFSMDGFYKSPILYNFSCFESGARYFFEKVYFGAGAGIYFWNLTWQDYNAEDKNTDFGLFAEAGLRLGKKLFLDLKAKYIFGFDGLSYLRGLIAIGLMF